MHEQFPVAGADLEMQKITEVAQVAALPFGIGKVGFDRHLDGAQHDAFRTGLARHQHQIPSGLWLPIDCMDERPTIRLADGTTDPVALNERRAGQLAGGTSLAVAKAAIAADAAFLRDARSMQDAVEKTAAVLDAMGIPDAAHEGCGASTFVLKSVAEAIHEDAVVQTFMALGATDAAVRPAVTALALNKSRRLENGFYSDWNPAWHADFVSSKHPENFSYLQTADDEVHGHHAAGLLLVRDDAYFAKNAFVSETGAMSFALTLGLADKIADVLSGNEQERALFKLAFRDDSFQVANHIVAPGLEVYADAA